MIQGQGDLCNTFKSAHEIISEMHETAIKQIVHTKREEQRGALLCNLNVHAPKVYWHIASFEQHRASEPALPLP